MSEVRLTPIACRINNDFADNYAFTKRGVNIAVVTGIGEVTWEKDVWQRGTWLRWRPFYDRRIARARRKADRVLSSMRCGQPA